MSTDIPDSVIVIKGVHVFNQVIIFTFEIWDLNKTSHTVVFGGMRRLLNVTLSGRTMTREKVRWKR